MSILKSLVLSLLLLTTTAFAQSQPVWIDVRTVEEFSTDHIEGDANIPLASIDVEKLAAEYGKDAEIMLYCRSGNRAGQAKALLEQAGLAVRVGQLQAWRGAALADGTRLAPLNPVVLLRGESAPLCLP